MKDYLPDAQTLEKMQKTLSSLLEKTDPREYLPDKKTMKEMKKTLSNAICESLSEEQKRGDISPKVQEKAQAWLSSPEGQKVLKHSIEFGYLYLKAASLVFAGERLASALGVDCTPIPSYNSDTDASQNHTSLGPSYGEIMKRPIIWAGSLGLAIVGGATFWKSFCQMCCDVACGEGEAVGVNKKNVSLIACAFLTGFALSGGAGALFYQGTKGDFEATSGHAQAAITVGATWLFSGIFWGVYGDKVQKCLGFTRENRQNLSNRINNATQGPPGEV
jgi:hypothetical protein